MATTLWRDASDEPLPRLEAGDPERQIESFELRLVDMLCDGATSTNAREVAEKTWDLVHDRSDDDPVKRRVVECHQRLARLSAGADPPAG